MNTIFNDSEKLNINGIIDFVLIIVGIILINVLVFILLKRKVIRITSVSLSVLLIVSHILKFEYLYNLLLFVFIALIIISIFTNLSTIREFIVNKTSLKKKNKEGINKKNDVEKIFNRDSLYATINETTLYLSKHKIGAIMTFEKKDKLDGYMKNGTIINAPVCFELLITVFYPGTRLHDGAVIIRGNTIVAASVYYSPTTKPLIGKYGSRHRASIGISEQCDAVTIVVSEETGRISIAYNGEIQSYSSDQFIKVFENLMNEDDVSFTGE